MRAIGFAISGALLLTAAAWAARIFMLFWFSPEPLEFGTIQRAYEFETGFTVDRVRRVREIRTNGGTMRAHGEFYIVDARVLCPFGDRYVWNDARVHVETFSGLNGHMRGEHRRYAVVEPAPPQLVLGKSLRRTLVFDLPVDVEQPAVVFDDANAPSNLPALFFGKPWQPARFNIRED